MAEIDGFAALLFEEAKRFLEKAKEAESEEARVAYLHAALTIGFCSLEAHVNAIAEDFLSRPELTPHEKSILSEKRVELERGSFVVKEQLQIYRLEDRLLFLMTRFSGQGALDRTSTYWTRFNQALGLRNKLSHPKATATVTEASVTAGLLAILDVLDIAYKRIYGLRYPAGKKGLHSSLNFC